MFEPDREIVVGRVGRPHGLKGWCRVWSFTEPEQELLRYPALTARHGTRRSTVSIAESQVAEHATERALLVRFEGCDDRDGAQALNHAELLVRRAQMPEPAPGEYYWADLEGLEVHNLQGVSLGTVDHLLETGANDVLVLRGERERLVPFVQGRVVLEVDIAGGRMQVDWHPDD